jgi:hypothetical protein
MSTCTKCNQHTYAPNESGECMTCAPEESVDWQSRALAAEARTAEIELRAKEIAGACFTAQIEVENLQPLADLARKIGEAKRDLAAAIHAPKFPGWIAAASGRKRDLAALLDQAAALEYFEQRRVP